jgi:D-beta-D-heptose 7-phosphate kinase/D-beta-D-heptose 1-phosphate adenosyltransferase
MRPNAAIFKAVAAFSGKRVLVAGDLMLDRYWVGEVDRISPEAPVPILRKSGAFGVPGGAANTACNVAALGARVTLFGVTGQDEAGAELRGMLSKRGIDCSRISIAAGRPTTLKLRIMAHDRQMLRIDEEDTAPIEASLAVDIVRRVVRLIPRVDAVVISDYAKGFAIEPVVVAIILTAARHGKPVVVDPKGSSFERYRGATVLKPNRNELALLTGLPARQHQETMHAARHLLQLAGPAAIVVTEGKDGMTLLRPEVPEEHFPSFAREVYDVTGAGDTALATLAVALAAGAPLSDAVWLSNLAAGLAVGESGTVAVSREKLTKALASLRRSPSAAATSHAKDSHGR